MMISFLLQRKLPPHHPHQRGGEIRMAEFSSGALLLGCHILG